MFLRSFFIHESKNISTDEELLIFIFYFLIYKSFPKSLTRECILDANNW